MKNFCTAFISLLTVILLWVLVNGCGEQQGRKEESPKGELLWSEEAMRQPEIFYQLVWPNKSKDKKYIVLYPDKENEIEFYISPEEASSIPFPASQFISGFKGERLPLTISLVCPFNDGDNLIQQEISYRPAEQKSSKAIFTIVPSSKKVTDAHHKGNLQFIVAARGGNAIDTINVQAFVLDRDPTAEEKAPYQPPSRKIPSEPVDLSKSPDIRITILPGGDNDPLSVYITLIKQPDLEKEFLKKEFQQTYNTEDEKTWKFESSIKKEGLTGAGSPLKEIYEAYLQLMHQRDRALREEFAKYGENFVWTEEAIRELDFSKIFNKILSGLKEKGQNLYREVFGLNPGDELRCAIGYIENCDPKKPLRIEIQTRGLYVPWQILYPSNLSELDPEKFWGFRYELCCDVFDDSHYPPGRSVQRRANIINYKSPAAILFAGYNGEDDVGKIAKKFEGLFIKNYGKEVQIAFTKADFLRDLLEDKNEKKIGFIYAYGHARSGQDLVSGFSEIFLKQSQIIGDNVDAIVIRVKDDLSGRFDLGPDGKFEYGKIGYIQVRGKTKQDLCNELTKVVGKKVEVTLWEKQPPKYATSVGGAALEFSSGEKGYLRPSNIAALAENLQLKNPIVILNACETGIYGTEPMNHNGFVGAFTKIGAGAVIVTESVMEAYFGKFFGEKLVEKLLKENKDVSEAMRETRLHFLKPPNGIPLGLIYTLYGTHDLRIKREKTAQ